MSKYTTGEIAKLCSVTVRTVQYYDSRGILVPNSLSDGGRRLYSEDDLKRMKIICFLRELDIPIQSIGQLLNEEDPASVISILLDQQTVALKEEIHSKQEKLHKLEVLQKELKTIDHFSVESIGDIAYIMENRRKMNRIRAHILTAGIIAELIEIGTLLLWIFKGIWLPFVLGLPFVFSLTGWTIWFYYRKVRFICPRCHTIFQPKLSEMIFSNNTLTTRKLTCVNCARKGFCVETYGGEET